MATKHTYRVGEKTETRSLSLAQAIRKKCLDCSFGSSNEVKLCTVQHCPLFPFRFGKDPGRKKVVLSEERKKAMAAQLKNVRESSQH